MTQSLSQGRFKGNGYIVDKNLRHSSQERISTEHPLHHICWPQGVNQKYLTHTGYSIIPHVSNRGTLQDP